MGDAVMIRKNCAEKVSFFLKIGIMLQITVNLSYMQLRPIIYWADWFY